MILVEGEFSLISPDISRALEIVPVFADIPATGQSLREPIIFFL
jgi:hypothetical protein